MMAAEVETVRLRWSDLPAEVRQAAEVALVVTVVGEMPQSGGFSPGVASRLRLANGDRVFAKAVSAERDPRSPQLYRREAAVMAKLPAGVPAPALRWFYDDGRWVLLALEDIDGWMPALPWTGDGLGPFVATLADMARALTPCPVAIADSAMSRAWRMDFRSAIGRASASRPHVETSV